MAKKQKRNVSQGARVSAAPSKSGLASDPTPASPRSFGSRQPLGGLRPSATADFSPDYTYAKQDLKRVGITAAGFIGALIVLYFLLPLFIK
jgi:hypothetical protein